jgi:Lrp/AsnC family leucine-responsive transcriptional regulator
MDRFDKQILAMLQADADLTSEQLAARVALSPSAIQRRVRRMKDDRVIERMVAVVDPKTLGPLAFFVVGLQIERERPELLTQLRRWLREEPQVQQAFYVTGDADFILIVTAPDMDSYENLMSRLMTENVNVRRYTTNVSLGLVKRGLEIALTD